MKLSISNIAWDTLYDTKVYQMMKEYGYTALEIAPTRIFSEKPYDRLEDAGEWSSQLYNEWKLQIASMQSIWYGKNENIFGTLDERAELYRYTLKAIEFAEVIHCNNLVFGCPRNRVLLENTATEVAVEFFKGLGDYAARHNTVLSIEANPPIYNTNYINDTNSALELIQQVNSPGFLLNLDVGTLIENQENIEELINNVKYIHHVHISEPQLKIIEKRHIHSELKKILEIEMYEGYISVEMGKIEDMEILKCVMEYIADIFG